MVASGSVVAAGAAGNAGAASCTVASGTCFPNNDYRVVKSTATSDGSDCCAACQADNAAGAGTCAGWTLNQSPGSQKNKNSCFLKSKLAAPTKAAGCTSGTASEAPFPPPPAPAPTPPAPPTPAPICAGGYCLYDVAADQVRGYLFYNWKFLLEYTFAY